MRPSWPWMDETVCAPPVVGTDEAGRGPLAGPVVAAAVWIDPAFVHEARTLDPDSFLHQIRDSKKLSADQREALAKALEHTPRIRWAVASCSVEEIDRLNIRRASLEAMRRAWLALGLPEGGTLLVDGRDPVGPLPALSVPVIRGDQRVLSCAAASIIAKVHRDRWMDQLHQQDPRYGWNKNRGYGTRAHLQALQTFGPGPWHRRSFRPVQEALQATR